MFLQYRAARALVIGAGIALAAAACGGSSSGGGTQSVGTNSGGGTGGSASTVSLTSHSGPDGKYMTDSNGRTVYIFSKDTSSMSECSGACASEWPPVKSGGTQMTYRGHPVYYFANDQSTGDMNGQGLNDFGGLWTAVTPAGNPVSASTPSSSPSSSGSSSEWG